jgi:hypothetical protein
VQEVKMPSKKPMIKRRTETPLRPQQLFDEVLFSPLYWPGKTVSLERNSVLNYCHRSTSAHISVAELYHENSKLFPQMLSEFTVSFTQADEFRREFLRRRAVVARASGTLGLELDRCWYELLNGVAGTAELDLFYAVELRLVADGLLVVYEPISDTLQVVKQFSASDLDMLRHALRLMDSSEAPLDSGPLLLILGSFARNDVLLGSRGYRRTLLEVGRLAQEIVHQAERLGLVARPLYEFIDHDVDAVMEADGIEQSTLMAFEFGGITDVG